MTTTPQTAESFEAIGLSLSPIARPVLLVLGFALCMSPFALNSGLLALAFATLIGIIVLTWQNQGPPVGFLICGVQWLQGSAKLLDAELRGKELWTLSTARAIEDATALTMLWALALALGIRLAMRDVKFSQNQALPSVRVALVVYLSWSLLMTVAALVVPDAARQAVVALSNLRWATVFVLIVAVLQARRGFGVLAIVLVTELGLGFLAYFSNFKTVLVVFALALMARNRKFSVLQLVGASATMVVAIYLGILWTAVKGDYRSALSGGRDDQSVRMDTGGQAKELGRLVRGVDDRSFGSATNRLVERIGYVDYFAHTIGYVPRVRPHEGGRLWWSAFEHIFMPRALFPDKAPLPNDTEVAERFTGLMLTYNRTGTSIALGLPAETYVDFGAAMMLPVAVVFGVLNGLIFRKLLTRRRYSIYGSGFAVGIATTQMLLESSPAKAMGSLLTLVIIAVVVWYTLLPWLLRFASRFE